MNIRSNHLIRNMNWEKYADELYDICVEFAKDVDNLRNENAILREETRALKETS